MMTRGNIKLSNLDNHQQHKVQNLFHVRIRESHTRIGNLFLFELIPFGIIKGNYPNCGTINLFK